MTLDPDAARFLELMRAEPPLAAQSVEQVRARVAALPGPAPKVNGTRDIHIPLKGRTLAGRVYTANSPDPGRALILFFHGGGWVTGSLDSHDHLARALCRDCESMVLSLDYRLAPEHPYPAAADDAYEATIWVAENLARTRPIILAGDSAGGNLAASAALQLRDRGGPAIAMQLLIYPVTDCCFETQSYVQHGEGLNLTRRDMQRAWEMYCPHPADRLSPYAAPMQEFDLSRLPAAILVSAGYDPLYSDGLLYAERLRNAGIDVFAIDCPGMVHGFMRRINTFQKARDVSLEIGRIVRSFTDT